MPDREKVTQCLETCVSGCKEGCPYEYKNFIYRVGCKVDLMRDALALLKEQEEQIEQLEHDLAVTQNNLNYYVNGND